MSSPWVWTLRTRTSDSEPGWQIACEAAGMALRLRVQGFDLCGNTAMCMWGRQFARLLSPITCRSTCTCCSSDHLILSSAAWSRDYLLFAIVAHVQS